MILAPLFSFFESLIKPFRDYPAVTPPTTVQAFFTHFLRQVWPVFAVLLVVGLAFTLTEVMVFQYIARVIDILTHAEPERLWAKHGHEFITMLLVLGVLSPALLALHSLILQQAITSNLPTLIRWQS
ncbi:MAG: multidrug ABC transporter ATP-binding protein, partial [Asticcacaulis sp. 32-58-5]